LKKLTLLVVLLAFGATASPAFGQATRTWVSGTGDDINPCSRTAPCKTFAGAISKTFIGGEIDVLDPASYGTLTITKSITIDGEGGWGSVLASGTNGFNINIAPNLNDPNRRVVLRNLTINGSGASGTAGTNTGVHGINVNTNGAETIELENLQIFGFSQDGIRVAPTAAAPTTMNMTLDNVNVANNFLAGLLIQPPDDSHQVNVLVRNSVLKGTRSTGGAGVGLLADTGAHAWLTGTSIFNNDTGLKTGSTFGSPGVIDSFCDNQIGGNTDNGPAPNELCPQPQPQIITNTVGIKQCVVPKLKGLTTSFAKRLLSAANCKLGKVTKKATRKRSQVGKVMSQKTRAGSTLAQGTAVAVTVGKKKR
jgi:PASTA domain